jgi:hypothetical protein
MYLRNRLYWVFVNKCFGKNYHIYQVTAVYYIFLISFLGFPFIALVLSWYLKISWSSKFVRLAIAFFGLHNLLFFFGYSLEGDYIDYTIFSVEYFFFCLAIFVLLKSSNAFIRFFRVLGLIVISLGVIFGLIGILFFIFITMDYESDRILHFESNNKNYETRRYSFGGATLSDTKYTFETYREFRNLPIEHKVDKTIFFDDKTDLDISEPQLKINVVENAKEKQIVFTSSNGKTFVKSIN